MIVTENGIGTDDDQQRINYIKTAIEGLQRCLDDGLDIRLLPLVLSDNFEWLFAISQIWSSRCR